MSINHEKYTLVIIGEYSRYTWVYFLRKKSQIAEMIMSFVRMVENQNDIKFKQIRTDNGTEFRNTKIESFCDEKGISRNFSSPYTPEQNGVAERKNRTLIEVARTMLNGSVLSKYFWTEAEDDPSRQYQIDSDISYYIISQGRSLIELTQEKYVPEVIAPNEQDNPQTKDVKVIMESLVKKKQKGAILELKRRHLKKVLICINTPYPTRKIRRIYASSSQERVLINSRSGSTKGPSRQNTKVLVSNIESSVLDVSQPYIFNQASTSSHPDPRDRWSKDKHIELVNIIGNPSEGMLTRSMAAKLTAASASECLFANFLSEIEPKKFEKLMTKKFEMSMMGELTYFLGLQIKKDDKGISICQEQYTRNLLKKYEISDSSSVKTPMVPLNNLGPNLAGKPISVQSKRITSNSCEKIFRYLKGTPSLGLYYLKCSGFDLQGYSDSYYVGCNMDRKSISCACQILGGKLVCWSAKKQQSVAMSSVEAEYIAVAGYPETTTAYHKTCKYLMNCPLAEAFKKTPSVVYQNLLREFWCIAIATHPKSPTDDSEVHPLKEYKIKFLAGTIRPLSKSIPFSNSLPSVSSQGQRFISYALAVLLGPDYTQDESFRNSPTILSNSNFSKDPSKFTPIELTAFMVAINNHEHSVSPLPFTAKKKK
ncbi:retrovirus-related pol polyprotein from transposon TNT 1-94 [Tanacetum coccineum]